MQEITLRRLLVVAGKHWGLIAGACWLGTAAAAYLTVFVLTPIYQSTAVVLVKPGRELLSELAGRSTPLLRMDSIVMAELEILYSEDLARDVVGSLGPETLYPEPDDGVVNRGVRMFRELLEPAPGHVPDPFRAAVFSYVSFLELGGNGVPDPLVEAVRKFREDTSATVVPGTEVIRISYRHPDPHIAARSVNRLVDGFKEHHLRAFSEPQSTRFLEEKVVLYRDELEESEARLQEFQEHHPVLVNEIPAQTLEERRMQLDSALKGARNEIAAQGRRVRYMRENQGSLPRTAALHQELEFAVMSGLAELAAQQARAEGLQRQLAELDHQIQALPAYLRTYRRLTRETDANEKRYRDYEERFREGLNSAEMDRRKIANISVIQRGRAPLLPSSPRKMFNLLVGGILGFGLGFGLALVREGAGVDEAKAL
ncbi:MAG: Wzz/FepE/Etk N-terminal domain-containing protein [Myxococcota bacterium]